jgi:hypothetical protein
MAHDSKPSGKVGAQEAGRGSQVGREARNRVDDHVDAGVGDGVGLEREGAVADRSALGNMDRVDNDQTLNGPSRPIGNLDTEDHTLEEKVASVQGIQTGGARSQDEEDEEPALARRTVQSSQDH